MPLTKEEKRKLKSLRKRLKKLEQDNRKFFKDAGKELVRQMKKS